MNGQRGVTRPACPTTVADSRDQSKAKLILFRGCIFIGYNYLMKFLELKYQGDEESPFKSHRLPLMCTYFLLLMEIAFVLAMLCCDFGRGLYKKSFPRHD